MSEISLIAELILKLLPILKPSERDKIQKELNRLEEDWKNDKTDLEKALVDPINISAVNRLLTKYIDVLFE